MNNTEYVNSKILYSYNLKKQRKFFRKARAIVLRGTDLLVIRVNYKNNDIHYLLPGGGVDDGETIKQAVVRETLEEYSVNVRPVKYLGSQYYNVPMELNGEKFISNRVEYFYVCEYLSDATDTPFGVEGEFEKDDRTYTKTTLSLAELKNIPSTMLNNMDQKNYDKLIAFIESKK